ncbi:MAG TPA: methylated-DNA--[protein]-cysteine S-methyltransferase [Gemmatimonadales bacterium]|nr:methylated-DNA--[protein]-cysteine S-methyltransferase [Gemmatimonadales bacterium]
MGAVRFTSIPSPIGDLFVAASEKGLTCLLFDQRAHGPDRSGWEPDDGSKILAQARRQLDEYFDHRRTTFDLPLDMQGTPFQLQVWEQLTKIPYGSTTSYGEIAKRLGNPTGSRAVGAANGRNPVALVVPCHRVIGANGDLTGFGGGMARKEWLLKHEGSILTLV